MVLLMSENFIRHNQFSCFYLPCSSVWVHSLSLILSGKSLTAQVSILYRIKAPAVSVLESRTLCTLAKLKTSGASSGSSEEPRMSTWVNTSEIQCANACSFMSFVPQDCGEGVAQGQELC